MDSRTVPATCHGRRLRALALAILLPASAAPAQPDAEAQPAPGDAAPATPAPGSAPVAVPAYRQANKIAVLTIEGPIDRLTLRSLERRFKAAREGGAEAVVLDVDTPGGELGATLDICHLIKTDAPANTVSWINPEAYSAGTIISLACREIVVAPNATFGDAAPIKAGPFGLQPLPVEERAKLESVILEEVVDSARRNHYDENLVKAFVSTGVELWMIENVHTGAAVFVDRAEYEAVFGEAPPTQLTRVAPPDVPSPVTPLFNTAIPRDDDEQGGLDPATLRKVEAFTQSLPPARQPLGSGDAPDWRLVTQVISSDQLLTVKPAEAKFYGLATATVANDQALKTYFGASELVRYDRSWSEAMVSFLTQPIVMGVLIVVFLVCLFIELSMPGVGVFGATSGLALILLIGAPFLAGMAQWWDILLVVVGLLLVAAELFLIPGFGIAGVAGVASLLVGLIGTFVSGDISSSQGQTELITGLLTTLTSLFAAGIAVWLVSRQVHSLPLLNRLILHTEVSEQGGEPAGLLAAMGSPGAEILEPGAEGVAITDLRPAGRAEFDGRVHDVKSVGSFIEKGSTIRVVSADRFAIQVEEAV